MGSTISKEVCNSTTTTTSTTTNTPTTSTNPETNCPVQLKSQTSATTTKTKTTTTTTGANPPANHPPFLSSSTITGGGCPVKHRSNPKSASTSSSGGGCPVKSSSSSSSSSPPPDEQKQQQYNVYSQPLDPKNNMPSIANQLPTMQQKEELPTERKVSSIPKGGTDSDTWVYPSPQMFYNALARKNKLGDTKEEDIPSVVALHNNMNEKTWAKILEWESVLNPTTSTITTTTTTTTTTTPKLSRFLGRPSDLSPKALLKHYLFSHPLPFDRHDWTILRPDGTEVRYVIDYYHDETRASEQPDSGMPDMDDHNAVQSILVDVRPAIDSISEIQGRCFTMPLAQLLGNSQYEYLPMVPTKEMVGQTKESLVVWDTIQKAAEETKKRFMEEKEENKNMNGIENNDGNDDNDDDDEISNSLLLSSMNKDNQDIQITPKEASELAKSFAQVLQKCSDQKKIMESCEQEEEYAQASLALSMCMAQIICPLQHKTVVKTLHSLDENEIENDNGDNDAATSKMDIALENMMLCVGRENERVVIAKRDHPNLFQE